MVSEDSQELRWLPVVHCLSDRSDRNQPVKGQMSTFLHHVDDRHELLEVLPLCGSKPVLLKERYNPLQQVLPRCDLVPQEILLMVVASSVQMDFSAFEEVNEIVQDLPTGSSLDHGERNLRLPSEGHTRALDDPGAEAPFAIDEPNDPSSVLESFLLVFRRGALYATRHRIVTAHIPSIPMRCDKR